jgi:cephalosporin-C deacetylase-like acetyl esterase
VNPFNYNNPAADADLRLKKETDKYLHYEVSLKSAVDTGYTENSIITGEYYRPKSKGKVPLVILVHGLGDYSVIPCKFLARKLVKQNIACFVPFLSIHSKRLPKVLKEHMPYLTTDEWFDVYRVSVVDIRQVLDWACTRDEIDGNHLFVSGISFGGFVSAIAMGVDRRINAGILIVTGGNANKISWLNKEGRYRKRYRRTESEHQRVMDNYRQYLEKVETHGFDNAATDDKSFLTDPLTFATSLKNRPVLMINAERDKYIPKETVIELWEAIGKPEIRWFPSGHVTLWFRYPAIYRIISEFLTPLIQK